MNVKKSHCHVSSIHAPATVLPQSDTRFAVQRVAAMVTETKSRPYQHDASMECYSRQKRWKLDYQCRRVFQSRGMPQESWPSSYRHDMSPSNTPDATLHIHPHCYGHMFCSACLIWCMARTSEPAFRVCSALDPGFYGPSAPFRRATRY